jgi:hypothetical protein
VKQNAENVTNPRSAGKRGMSTRMSTGATTIAGLVLAGVLASSPVQAAPPRIELEHPRKTTSVRGEPALLEVVLAPEQAWAVGVQIEIDGERRQGFMPWSRRAVIELEPGLHRVAVVGRDVRDGELRRSKTVQVAVFEEAQRKRMSPRARHGWTAAVAFVIAIGGATVLRRRAKL